MDDLIRRQDLNETMKEMIYESNDFTEHHLLSKVWDRLRNIESVQQTGKWILHTYMPHHNYCSECGKDSPYNKRWDYCPYCGARMDDDADSD